jgi:hypothetical protein
VTPNPPAATPTRWLRLVLVVAAGAVAVWLLVRMAPRLGDPAVWELEDFVVFWAAAHLNLTGGNPYSPHELLALEQQAGWVKSGPLQMWYPPWTLTYLMPFCFDGFALGRLLWLICQVGALLFCAERTWRLYAPASPRLGIAWVLVFSFFPTLLLIRLSQTTFLPLLGVVAFLHLERARKDFLAGAVLALAAAKPHLAYLVLTAVFGWALLERRWRIIGGLVAAGLASLLAPVLVNPQVYAQYHHTMTHYPPGHMVPATLGAWLRLLIGEGEDRPGPFWVQLVPTVLGLVWLAGYAWGRRGNWNWTETMPILLFASVLTGAYGWSYDLVLLLVPLIQAATWAAASPPTRTTWLALAVYALINGLAFVLNRVWQIEERYYVWMAPALLLGYLVVRAQARRDGVTAPSEPAA